MQELLWLWYGPLLGIVAGLLSGMLGIGGGIVLVPALIYLLPHTHLVEQQDVTLVAIATSLATIIVTTFSAARTQFKAGNLDFKLLLPVATGVAILSLLASMVATRLSNELLTLFFAVLMIALALQMVLTRKIVVVEEQIPANWKLFLGGGITGFLAAMGGLGGGVILVPYLTAVKVAIHRAIALASASGVVVASFGSLGYLINGWGWHSSFEFVGYVHWPFALSIILSSYFTARIGVKLGHRMAQKQLKKWFAVFMVVVALKLIIEHI